MKNTTVKELIEILQGMNPDAVVCGAEQGEYPEFATFEICSEYKDASYLGDSGDVKVGDIVVLYL